jgi:ribokinase
MSVGGKATNVFVALSKLGIKSYLIARAGDDEFGRYVANKLKELGVETRVKEQSETGITFIIVDKDRNNTMFNHLGANKNL